MVILRPPPTTFLPKQTNAFGKVRLLLWKNFLMQKRHKIHTIVDLFLPVLFFVFCAWLQKERGFLHVNEKIFPSLPLDTISPPITGGQWVDQQLVFAPKNDIFKNLVDHVTKKFGLKNAIGVDDSSQLQQELIEKKLFAGIEFHHPNNVSELPKNLAYSLRFPDHLRIYYPNTNWQTNELFPPDGFAIRYQYYEDGGPPSYYNERFLALQNAIAKAFIISQSPDVILPEIQMQRFPIGSRILNLFLSASQVLMPLFFLMSLNYTFTNTVRYISIEKEKQLKEAMKIMGLANWMHYLSWFIRTIVMLVTTMVFITLLMTVPLFGAEMAIFPHSSYSCLLVFFIAYCICLIPLCFVICAIFSKSKSAMTGSTVIWYIMSGPFFLTYGTYDHMSVWLKVLFCFCPNTAVSYAFTIISRLEDVGVGLNWTTAFQTTSIYDNLTIAWIFGILIANAFILFLITLYLENVMPGGNGVAKPWNFLFKKDFWQSSKSNQQLDDQHTISEHYSLPQSSPTNFEKEPRNQPIGIEIRRLTKQFSNDKAAVNKLSLNIFDNQITCLLGQNGAGKTTTISMLTGMIEPTHGTAIINGFDIRTNMDDARGSMGFCPQHNILFDELTVREHILFYCCLKGLSNEVAESEVKKYVQLLELEGKENALSSTLSGGMKRKLSVGIALCGQSKVVFLDEPTSGMDPGARRALWDILLAEKKDRTILLTTHFMDEADVLSDRIAILAEGELKCTGSSFFLKKRFGTGYHLICAKDRRCDTRLITELLRKYISDIRVDSENETEVTYILPEERNDLFTTIFEDLENNESRLNLKSFGVSLTTLEEIFLKLGKSDKLNANSSNGHNPTDVEDGISENRITSNDNQILLDGICLLKNQAAAIFKKRYLVWLRSWMSFCYHNIFVIFVLSFIIFDIGNPFSSQQQSPSLDITLDKYESPIVVLQENSKSGFTKQYQQMIEKSAAKLHIAHSPMPDTLLAIAQSSMKEYYFQYLTAASDLNNNTIIAWFNNQAIHSAALALDLVHNALVKLFTDENHSIRVSNAPVKFPPKNDTIYIPNVDVFGYSFVATIGIIVSVLSATYIAFYIREKECNARFLQYASGVSMPIFWGASILWDLLTNCITISIIIILLAFGQHNYWRSPSELAIVFLLLFIYNFAMMPFICILSLFFTKPSFGMNVTSISNFVIMVAFMITYSLKNTPINVKTLYHILRVYPLCTVLEALLNLPILHSNEAQCKTVCKEKNCDWEELCRTEPKCCPGNIFSWHDGIGENVVIMVCTGIVAFIILVVIELGALKMIKQFIFTKRNNPNSDSDPIDDDVLAEKNRINNMRPDELKSEVIAMKNVSKFYGNLCAVNKMTIGIKRGECFGLLGKNGAGKSSIFKMLTGETMISSGEIFTQGFNQKYQLHDIHKIMGYCPQFDALLTGLTCRETLEIFAMVRGIPGKNVKNYIENCARNLDFIQHIDKKVKQLSGGNKRKLSTSLAIIGNLNVIFLDEPTTGLDPATKRNLWNVVIQSRESGKSIVLTSHSMEECEALCTRITVFVNGQSKCLGSSQHLKNKFCKGFELKVKVKQDDETNDMHLIEVKNFIVQTFSGAAFREEYQGILTYSVPAEYIKWSTVFGIMENAKKTLNIDDYSISQNSLEQVVLMFVKDQHASQSEEPAFV